MADASDLWNMFFQNRISTPHIELFDCENLKVESFLRGRSKRRYLKRNPKMESRVREVCQNIIDSYHESRNNHIEEISFHPIEFHKLHLKMLNHYKRQGNKS